MGINFNIISMGKTPSSWINSAFNEYAKRFPKPYTLNLIEIPTIKRTKSGNIQNITASESQKLLSMAPKSSHLIALDERGKQLSTMQLANQLVNWCNLQKNISFLINGPDGWNSNCLNQVAEIWSLSKLTFPHHLVRIIIAEQLYRALSIINHHPYHRN